MSGRATGYRTVWCRCWTLAATLAIGLSFLAWSPTATLRLFVWSTVATALLLWLCDPVSLADRPAGWGQRRAIRSLAGGALVVAVGFLAVVLPFLAVPVVLVAALSSPWVVERRPLQRWLTGRGDVEGWGDAEGWGGRPATVPAGPGPLDDRLPTVPPVVAHEDQQVLRTLSDAELCRRWRRSYAALRAARSGTERARVAAVRRDYLDELERRCPAALAAWLDSGAPPSGGLERSLATARDEDGQDRDDAA